MAIVKLFDECEELDDGDASFQVYIDDYSRYTGPAGTDWQLVDSSSYQFRTPADNVADVVEAVREGKMTLKAAWTGSVELREVFEQYSDGMEDEGPAKTKTERVKDFIELVDIDELFTSLLGDNPYWQCEDAFNQNAIEVLDYPRWAKGELDHGGMGVIVIKKGHDLGELWQWLEKRQAEILAGKDQPAVAKTTRKNKKRAR